MKNIVVLFLCLGLFGCASFSAIKYNDDIIYSPTNPNMVKVFNSEPPQAYERIGEVSSIGAPYSNRNNIVERLKGKAAEMGGDAIILQSDEVTRGVVGNANSFGGSTSFNANIQRYPVMQGIVIKFEKNKVPASQSFTAQPYKIGQGLSGASTQQNDKVMGMGSLVDTDDYKKR